MEYISIKTIADKMTVDLSSYVDALFTAEVIDRKSNSLSRMIFSTMMRPYRLKKTKTYLSCLGFLI